MTEITPQERAALARIEELEDPARLRVLIENARRKKSEIVEAAAFRRLCHVQPDAQPGSVKHDVWQAVHALEEMLSDERRKTVRLSRTRQKIARHGEAKTVADLTLKPEPSPGFTLLVDRGAPQLLFEVVALRHPTVFDETTRDAARIRLIDAGLDPDNLVNSSKGG